MHTKQVNERSSFRHGTLPHALQLVNLVAGQGKVNKVPYSVVKIIIANTTLLLVLVLVLQVLLLVYYELSNSTWLT